jgi:hypothetical protein
MQPLEPRWLYYALSLFEFFGVPILLVAISATYFWADRTGTPLAQRILTSAHGAVAALIYSLAFGIWVGGASDRAFGTPLVWAQVIPVGLIVLSLVTYRGPKWLHSLQLLNVPAMLWVLFIGSMAITNDWL